jgi:cytoskeleton protein RodZ
MLQQLPTFGENLRREREMRGVTLEEISDTTKISVRLLKALEEDDFGKLPGGVFTRSFIRSYAQFLGLDEEHVLAEYKRSAQPGSDNDFSRLAAGKPLPSKSGSQPRTLPWVVAAVLLAGGYAVYRYSQRRAEMPVGTVATPSAASSPSSASASGSESPSEPSASSVAQTPAGEGNPGSGSSSVSNSTASAQNPTEPSGAGTTAGAPAPAGAGQALGSPGQQTPSASNAAGTPSKGADASAQAAIGEGDLLLQVATNDEVWVAVAADGKTIFQRLLAPDSVRSFRAKDSFDVTTGNAQGTILTLNGETQKPLGRRGEFKKVHLTRSDFQSRTP